MVVSEGNERENWVRLTLRLPPELHAALETLSREESISLNGAIVRLLQAALNIEDLKASTYSAIDRLTQVRQEVEEKSKGLIFGTEAINELKTYIDEAVSKALEKNRKK